MTASPEFVDVAVNRPLDPLTYRVPEELRDEISPGWLVEVPLGTKNAIGCVVSVRSETDGLDASAIKAIIRRASPEYLIDTSLMKLARFIADYYFCSYGEALAAASIVGFHHVASSSLPVFRLREDWRAHAGALTKRQLQVCESLDEQSRPIETKSSLARLAGSTPPTIAKLEQAGLLISATPSIPEPDRKLPEPDSDHVLIPGQQEAFAEICRSLDKQEFRTYLLHGITGSGKTEIYLQAMARVLDRGQSALCLVPEISLTPQTVHRFESRFRTEIGVFHSQMTRRDKLFLYRKIESGRVRIVIGARSAIFAPLPNLGLIVVDEEHDGSYKQGEVPRYHARDIAIVRGQRLGIPVVLGSATPSMESYQNAAMDKYRLLHLPDRASGMELPPVRIVDLAREVAEGRGAGNFSNELIEAIRTRLERGEQSLLFLNRRGFSNFLFCPSCKWVARCEQDDVSLTVHKPRDSRAKKSDTASALDLFEKPIAETSAYLRCHFCGERHNAPSACPECGNEDLMTVGSGTQRIEEEISEIFPDANLLRLDYDTAGGREGFLRAWKKMTSGEADIILGTQMVAKGHHLERVTLVGVILADVGLFIPDFRAEERTFTLLTQVAGRAGRATKGEVIFQTYMPNHTAIRFAMAHDYEGFFAEELRRRRQLGFPPSGRLIALTFSDPDREKSYKASRMLAGILWRQRQQWGTRDLGITGPTIAPLARLGGRFRYRILLIGKSPKTLSKFLHAALADREFKMPSGVRLAIDVDPVDLL
ncbi:primosomal protein N' [bacterium]|nr:primosomal protein N' [bacterium]